MEPQAMITRATIIQQLDLYHGRLERSLEGLTEEEVRRVMVGRLAPMIWQVGHLAFVDTLFAQRAGGSHSVPERYSDLFKPGTGGEADYPPLNEVWAAFSGAHQALRAVADEADFSRPLEHPAGAYTSVGGLLLYACYHRGYHAGKTASLRALLGKPLPAVPARR